MQIDWDVAIPMADGVVLRADIFRPLGDKKVPVIVSYGPYAKGLDFRVGYKSQWARVVEAVPEILEGSSNKYQNWELVDPERWVPEGYACMRIDSRGAGRSPGLLDCWSPLETQDFHECIEWAGTQPWSNGKVGINGISYYAMNQWTVAATQPPHLAAICIWEGSSDYYRELCRHGGILCDFLNSWYNRQVLTVQNGVGDNGARSAVTGVTIAGPDTLSEEQLKKNRLAIDLEAENRHLVDEYYKSRTPDFSKITVPLLSAGNWGGMGLHTRGNFEGYLRAASKDKWLEVHGDTHFTHFYSTYGVELQKKFFAHFLKGEQSGWDQQPKVSLNIRHPHETFKLRAANEWPLANTQWTKFYLQPEEAIIDTKEPGVIADSQISYEIAGDGLTFLTPVRDYDFEITGPVAAKLFLSSETTDADVTLALRLYDPSGKEISFIGSNDPRVPVGLGWLRASHRKLDPQETKPYRPWHSHDELQPLTPGVPVELDIEILPTSIVVPKGYRLGLNVRGSDYEFDGTDAGVAHAPYPMKGVGPFTHTNASDRPANVFSGKNTLHFSSKMKPYLLLPIIPKE
ncbi:CocE/NonD family hydrolase [Polynucleobacter sp. Latsch14-2]|nr:CocE/NonD family hydrolase [Polynucleobacter sp. Latsch14-2]MBU3614091.1 CocE/NonD family hydrolase [Polynucleobacter sp. Latsch14-2]